MGSGEFLQVKIRGWDKERAGNVSFVDYQDDQIVFTFTEIYFPPQCDNPIVRPPTPPADLPPLPPSTRPEASSRPDRSSRRTTDSPPVKSSASSSPSFSSSSSSSPSSSALSSSRSATGSGMVSTRTM